MARALTSVPDLAVHHVQWAVDPRNPAWPIVRAAAIADAIAKARDYAHALDGSLGALVHVADEGLLGERGEPRRRESQSFGMGAPGGDGGPSLDPSRRRSAR